MRLSGLRHLVSRLSVSALLLAPLALGLSAAPAAAQTAPLVLPYTMSTFAGPHGTYTVGTTCGSFIALDSTGDGCLVAAVPFTANLTSGSTMVAVSTTAGLYVGQSVNGGGVPSGATITAIGASNTITLSAAATATGNNVPLTATYGSIGVEPHDIRVDGQGNIFWLDDNGSTTVIHKINAINGRMTTFVGSVVNTKGSCSTASDTAGDGCIANDNGANVAANSFTAKVPKSRGMAIAPNGDLYFADYNGNTDHRVASSTQLMSVVAGSGTSSFIDVNDPAQKSGVSGTRGIGVDAAGNVYIADTANNVIRIAIPVTGGYITRTLTALNGGAGSGSAGCTNTTTPGGSTHIVTSGVPAISAQVCAPEDVQVDSNGNIYIADEGDGGQIRAIYQGSGTLPGIVAPQKGYIYTIAGIDPSTQTAVAYPKDGTTPTLPANTISVNIRKFSFDNRNNLYLADSSANVIWFVDAQTGNIRDLAGRYGLTAGTAAPCYSAGTTAGNIVGDGCVATAAAIYSVSDLGTAPDNQGNLYINDAQGGISANSRIRKVLSGLNFPSVTRGQSVTQTVLVHFGRLDSAVGATAFSLSGVSGTNVDYALGTPTCTVNADTTSDCTLPVTFTPTQPGYDTATLTVTSTLGATSSFLLTGNGIAAAVTIDPGNVSQVPATVNNAQGIVTDGAGNIYTADTGNNRVLITRASTGATTVLAGTGTASFSGDGGPATAATLNAPRAVAVDTSGNVFIADTANNRVRRINASGIISTYAGGSVNNGTCAGAFDGLGNGCPATAAPLSNPSGLAADNLGNLYIADTGYNVIRQVSTSGYIFALAGGAGSICTANTDSFGDGCSANQTTFSHPTGLAFDNTNRNLIIADTGNNIVRSLYLGNTITGTATAYSVLINPVNLVAGNGTAGQVVDNNNTATLSELSAPSGVAVGPSGTVYIADSGNHAVRLVSNGTIATIIGTLGSQGSGTVPGTAANAQLFNPGGVAALNNGTLEIADSGNNRLLTDSRSQVTFGFGRTNIGFSSPVQTFTETSIGTVPAVLASPLLTINPAQTQFTLTAPTGSTGCTAGTFAVGATCILQGQFTPATTGSFSTTYVEANSNASAGDPSITITGTGAVLTKTTSTVAQTFPVTGNAQFGGVFTATATITPTACNGAAPSCAPTGTVRFIVDGGTPGSPIPVVPNATTTASTASQNITGLSVGQHTISCNYSGDNFYAASTCGSTSITITTATTNVTLAATNNNAPQYLQNNCKPDSQNAKNTICTVTTLTASLTSSGTAGVPVGTVTFTATGGPLGSTVKTFGTASVTPSGTASLPITFEVDANNNLCTGTSACTGTDNTLIPGTYQLGCTFSGSANFSGSTCAPLTFTVAPQAVDFSIATKGCAANTLISPGFLTPGVGNACIPSNFNNSLPMVATAQGSTADATIFVTANNTLNGTLTFSCSGLPQYSICTFQPTSLTFTSSTGFDTPQAVDMTLWTDIQPGNTTSLNAPGGLQHLAPGSGSNIHLAAILGWPATVLGLFAVVRFRRRSGNLRGLALLGLLLSIVGSSAAITGCGSGPGAYNAVLTPTGIYPITVNITGAGITRSTVVYWKVTGPGFPGQE